jgi:O-antigen ligase/tetratricopeptide (TPR) repeat protein
MKSINKSLENISDNIVILFVIALFLIDFLPHATTEDVIYPQFLYLAVLNFVMAVYITFKVRFINEDVIGAFKKSPVFWLFSIFVILCGLTFITAVNKTLVIEKLADLIIAFCLFVNFTFLLKNKLHLIPKVIFIICIVAFVQSALELYHFKRNFDKVSIMVALRDLGVSTGNINILAASLTIKLPFLLLGFSYHVQKRKFFLFITLVLVTTVVLLTAARAAMISTILVYILFIVYNIKINSFSKLAFLKVLTLIIPLVLSIVISNSILKKVTDNSRYVSVTNRLEQVNTKDASANARLVVWQNTFDLAKTKPLTGVGLGNYKIESIPYEKTQNDESTISQHSHNDFLQIISETGFINGFVYILFFLLIIIVNAKRFFRSDKLEVQSLAMLTIMITVVYGIDALLNFPMFKPTMMIFLCLAIIFTLINVSYSRGSESELVKNNFYGVIVLISVITIYFAFLGYQASNLEYLIKKDDANAYKNSTLTGDEVIKRIPKYKNTLTRGESFYEYAGIYYYNENKFDQALKYLSKADKINPYLGRVPFYKMRIALKKGNVDSAFVYSKQAYYMRPRNLIFYGMSTQLARGKKDTTEILKQHRTFITYRNIPQAWKIAADELKKAKYSNKNLLQFIDKGIKQFPADTTLLKIRNEVIAVNTLNKAQSLINVNKAKALESYLQALKTDPSNADTMQYLAFYYYNAKDYYQSLNYFLKALKLREFPDGRTEFFVGNCYLKINDKANACKYFGISSSKNYPDARPLLIQNCK